MSWRKCWGYEVTNLIEYFSHPNHLVLAWQAPDHLNERYRWAVGEIKQDPSGKLVLRYFRDDAEFQRLNPGRDFGMLKSLGYEGYPAFPLKKEIHENGVDDALIRRLPPANRPDYAAYQSRFCITPGTELSLIELLSVTEAKLPSDGFSVVDPLDPHTRRLDLMLEVAGYRYYAPQVGALMHPGKRLTIHAEPTNEHDTGAVRVSMGDQTVGYVNRLQAPAFQEWLKHADITATVQRMNGRPDHPRAYLFVRVRPQQLAAA